MANFATTFVYPLQNTIKTSLLSPELLDNSLKLLIRNMKPLGVNRKHKITKRTNNLKPETSPLEMNI